MIAVVGAGGKTGRAVRRALRRRGVRVRALVRRTSGEGDEHEVDLLDRESVRRALAGCDAVYHLAPNVHPDEERIGRLVLGAAGRSGVARVVYHSVLHPQVSSMPHHWAKLRVEERVLESGLDWTILQPAAYVQNFTRPSGAALRVPYDVDALFSLVDLHDVAEVAASVLTEGGHVAATYELAGPRPVTVREVATAFGATAERQGVEDWADETDLPPYAVAALTAMFRHYDRHGLVGNPHVLQMLLGRRPTDPLDALLRSAP